MPAQSHCVLAVHHAGTAGCLPWCGRSLTARQQGRTTPPSPPLRPMSQHTGRYGMPHVPDGVHAWAAMCMFHLQGLSGPNDGSAASMQLCNRRAVAEGRPFSLSFLGCDVVPGLPGVSAFCSLYESLVCNEYVNDLEGPSLLPEDSAQRAQARLTIDQVCRLRVY